MTFVAWVEWIVPLAFGIAVVALARAPGTAGRLHAEVWRWRWPVLVATRVLWPWMVWSTVNLRRGSDLGWRAARSARFLEGQIPGVDYPNFHAPLTPYLEGVGRWLVPGHPPVGALLFFLLADAAVVLLGARLARRLGGDRAEAWAGAWLLLTPLLWHQTGIRGQDEALFAAALAAGLVAALAGRDVLAGLVLAVGLASTKATFAPYAATLLLALGRPRWRAAAAFVGGVVAIHGAYALTGAPLGAADTVGRHDDNFGAGMGIPDTLRRMVPAFPVMAGLAFYAVVTGAVALAAPWRLRALPPAERALRCVAAVHAASMLSMPFCVSPYYAQGLPATLLLVLLLPAGRARALAWALPALALLAVMHWTKHPAFTVPVKPAMIAFHGALLVVALAPSPATPRATEGDGTAGADPAGGAVPAGGAGSAG